MDIKVGFVVITRNEEKHISACLSAILKARTSFPDAPIVLVDSNSTDRTVEIASQFAVTIYRYESDTYTAAAGRRIGFDQISAKYVLFVDGDCCIEANWLPNAIACLESSPDVAVIYGPRREIFDEVPVAYRNTIPPEKERDTGSEDPTLRNDTKTLPEDYGPGGNALYVSDALRKAGGFNPYLNGEEESELLGRIRSIGYRYTRTADMMFTHYTQPTDTVAGMLRRIQRRMTKGSGQVLRASLTNGLFFYHAWRYRRPLVVLAYFTLGIVLLMICLWKHEPMPLLIWFMSGAFAFSWLWYKRSELRSALHIAAHWSIVATDLVGAFITPPKNPDHFRPTIDTVKKHRS